ncbi:MAG: hypothetical protein ACK5Q5_24715 [Planctomycetaceae bacterium]
MPVACRCAAALVLLCAVGCGSFQLGSKFGRDTAASTATREQMVALVNRNVQGVNGNPGLKSWRCMQARFEVGPLMKASGTVIVEAPHSFRMRVSNPLGGGDELDVGSNNDEFWLWTKGQEPPAILMAKHEDLGPALNHFKIPFQPDWIMEVLGVVPIEAEEYELRSPPNSRLLELVSYSRAVTGQRVQKVIRVDPKRGQVTAHELWGENNKLIARAEFSDHRADKQTQVLMPRKIRVHWPEADLNLGITLDHVEINPPQLPELVWTMPTKPGCRTIDMGAYARAQTGSGGNGEPIQRVEHEPARDSRLDEPVPTLDSRPPRTAALEPAPAGARPFPGAATPLPHSAAPSTSEPAPLPATGRVRLDSLSP